MVKTKSILFFFLIVVVFACFCLCCNSKQDKKKLIIFHAGSLSVPMKEIAELYEKSHPDTKIILEAAGSRQCARKITDLDKKCDVMASADYTVIEDLLMPEYTNWLIYFASNEMCLAYTNQSKMSNIINQNNWYDIVLHKNNLFGRSNPNTDPCGYRTALLFKLAGIYYEKSGLSECLLAKDKKYIRPKEVDLLSLLESNAIDYIFIYKSVAIQHNLNILEFPEEIDLGNPEFRSYYEKAQVRITGKKPGDTIIKTGEPMIYALTIPFNAPNKNAAITFTEFLLNPEKGLEILSTYGQSPLIKRKNPYAENIPIQLKKFVKQ